MLPNKHANTISPASLIFLAVISTRPEKTGRLYRKGTGAREIRDIVERMLNQAYDLALVRDPSGKNMTGYLNIAPVMENEIPREAVVLQQEIPANCIRIISD